MSASSEHGANFRAAYGRLHGNRGDGWCALKPANTDDWLQVDLGNTFQVCAVATQGDRNGNERVTHFKLLLSFDNCTWEYYKDQNGNTVVRFKFVNKKSV